jgi:hypothetical protein
LANDHEDIGKMVNPFSNARAENGGAWRGGDPGMHGRFAYYVPRPTESAILARLVEGISWEGGIREIALQRPLEALWKDVLTKVNAGWTGSACRRQGESGVRMPG